MTSRKPVAHWYVVRRRRRIIIGVLVVVIGVAIGVATITKHNPNPSRATTAPPATTGPPATTTTAQSATTATGVDTATTRLGVVPNVIGEPAAQAESKLQANGYAYQSTSARASGAHITPGSVVSESPPAGSSLATGSTVVLGVVS